MKVIDLWIAYHPKQDQKKHPGKDAKTDSAIQQLNEKRSIGVKINLSPVEFEDFEERAGIIEFDGGLTREQAEQEALRSILTKRNWN